MSDAESRPDSPLCGSFCLRSQDGVAKLVAGPERILVGALRGREVSRVLIGAALGVSRQSAWERFS